MSRGRRRSRPQEAIFVVALARRSRFRLIASAAIFLVAGALLFRNRLGGATYLLEGAERAAGRASIGLDATQPGPSALPPDNEANSDGEQRPVAIERLWTGATPAGPGTQKGNQAPRWRGPSVAGPPPESAAAASISRNTSATHQANTRHRSALLKLLALRKARGSRLPSHGEPMPRGGDLSRISRLLNPADHPLFKPRVGPGRSCCIPRVPKTGSQNFWELVGTHCPNVAGHLVVNNPSPSIATNLGTSEYGKLPVLGLPTGRGQGNVGRFGMCMRSPNVTRLMIVRHPVKHYASSVSALATPPTSYLFTTILSETRKTNNQWPNGSKPLPLQLDSATPTSMYRKYPSLFNNPQARYLLGFADVNDGIASWATAVNHLRADRALAKKVVDQAVADLDLVAVLEQFDASVLALGAVLGLPIQGFQQLLHTSDSGYSECMNAANPHAELPKQMSTPPRLPVVDRHPRLTPSQEALVLEHNFLDKYLYDAAATALQGILHGILKGNNSIALHRFG